MPVTVSKQKSIWNNVLARIEKTLQRDRHNYQIFYSNLKLLDMDDENIQILAPSLLVKSYFLNTEHSSLLRETIKNITNKEYSLGFLLADEVEIEQKNEKKEISQTIQNKAFFANCKLNNKYTFDNFVIGDCNREVVTASSMIAQDPGKSFNPLFIYSKSGLGKTHLLHAIGNYHKEKNPSANILYITMDAFIDEFIKYVHGGQDTQTFKDFFIGVDILLVDDIQFLSNKTRTAEMFFHIFNLLVNNGKQIVLTADRHPRDLKDLEDRLVSRFNMGLSVSIQPPDTETLLEILKRKIELQGLDISNYDDDGLIFLAETFSKNVRELEGALNRLLFHTVSIGNNDRITLIDIKEAVNNVLPKNDKKRIINEDDIINEVSNYYSISVEQIKSPIRNAQVALARRISMYLCRSLLSSSYIKIGQVFKRDHSTVITAVEKVGKEIKTDTQLSSAISNIKKALKK